VFTQRAGDLGFPRRRGETPEEYRGRVVASGLLSDGHLSRLTALAVTAAYAPGSPAEQDATDAIEAAETALHELRAATPLGRRLLGLYRRDA
jgi:Domain of unknown function (DUF4129)